MHTILLEVDFFGLLTNPLPLHTYGALIALGFLLAMFLISRQAQQEGENPEKVVDLCFYTLLAGMIGARVVYIITKLADYLANPLEILLFWHGGLVWYGGFLGALGFIWYYSRRYQINFFKYLDIFIPYMALAHFFGRLGCLAAGCCFGKVTTLPWGVVFPVGSLAHQTQYLEGLIGLTDPALPVHPTQLYEAGFELLSFWLLLFYRRYKTFHGQLFLLWLTSYPIFRALNEIFRGDKDRGVYILSTSQYISILVGILALVISRYLKQRPADLV